MSVPSNLIPTTITQLPEYTGSGTGGYMPYVIDGRTYKVLFSNIASVGAVPASRIIAAGTGLTGGGSLAADRVIAIANGGVGFDQLAASGATAGTYGSGTTVPVLTVDVKGRVTAATTTPVVISGYVPEGRSVIAGTGLTGGGTLTSNVTLAVNFASSDPQALGTATAGVSTAAARGDHVHPAVNLSDTSQTQGALPLGRGGTGDALSPVAGAVVYSTGTRFALTALGLPGQVLVSNGTSAPSWLTVSGVGTVTSVNVSGGTTGLTFTGGPITSAGTITAGGTLGVANGGTGTGTAFTTGSLVFAGSGGVYSQNNGNLFWDNVNTRLGIGTASPATRLDVVSTFQWRSNTGGTDNINMFSGGAALAYFGPTTSTNLAVITNGAERMRITSGGDIGIGTTSPGGLLGIAGTTVIGNQATTGTDGTLRLVTAGGVTFIQSGQNRTSASAAPLAFTDMNGSSEWMRLTATGNLGIGTTSPGNKLAVAGGQINTVADGTYAIALNATTGNVRVVPYSATYSGSALIAFNAGYAGNGPFAIDASLTSFWTNGVERMRVNSSGNVGIGTASPGTPLDVTGTTRSGNFRVNAGGTVTGAGMWGIDTILAFNTGSTERMRIDASGNVGIGTATPAVRLDVSGGGIRGQALDANGSAALFSSSGGAALYYDGAGIGVLRAYSNSSGGAGAITFVASGSENMRINATGNVGIGTTTPSARLHVNGGNFFISASGTYTEPAAIGGVIAFDSTNGDLNISARSNGGNTFMRFFTSSGGTGTERLRIKTGGQVRFVPLAAAPSGAEAGDVYYDSTTNKLRCYNGTTWNDLF